MVNQDTTSTDFLVKTRLIALTDWPKHHTWPPLGGLRHLVFHAKSTGFDSVIKRVNRRILLDEAAFFEWVASKNAPCMGGTGS